jgi:hypothetical protein
MKNKDAGFGPAPSIPEQLAAEARLARRRKKAEIMNREVPANILRIVEEVIGEQLRQLRIDPFPTCPHCGTVFKGPATLYVGTKSKVTMAAADRILRGVPIAD